MIGEAMACGLPCVSTRVGDIDKLLEPDWIVEPGDDLAISELWQDLLDMPEASRQAIGASNRARIESQYSISSIADAYRVAV